MAPQRGLRRAESRALLDDRADDFPVPKGVLDNVVGGQGHLVQVQQDGLGQLALIVQLLQVLQSTLAANAAVPLLS